MLRLRSSSGALAAVLCLACSSAPLTPRGPSGEAAPRSAEVAEAYAGDVAAVPQSCVVDSPAATIELVTVRPKDAPPFALALEKVHVIAHPSALPEAPVTIEVLGAIQFRGLAMIESYAPKKPQMLAGGMLRAGRGARLVRAGAKGALLSGTMEVGLILVENVALPCASLEVPAEPSDATVVDEPVWGADGGDKPIEMWSQPGRGHKILVWPNLSFHRVDTRGKWTMLAVNMSDGSALHGWVDVANVTDEGYGGLFGLAGVGCGGSYGSHQIVGLATVRAGTKVSAIANGAPWGVVPIDTKMMVRYLPGRERSEDKALIDSLDGYQDDAGCPGLSRAYIPAGSFSFDKD